MKLREWFAERYGEEHADNLVGCVKGQAHYGIRTLRRCLKIDLGLTTVEIAQVISIYSVEMKISDVTK